MFGLKGLQKQTTSLLKGKVWWIRMLKRAKDELIKHNTQQANNESLWDAEDLKYILEAQQESNSGRS